MTVEFFECAYLELQPSGDYVRHVASFMLNAPFGDFVVLMMSPSSMATERQAEQDFGVVLDLTASETGEADVYAAAYTVASPQFMVGFTGTIEERTTALATVFRDVINPVYACSAITYSSATV
jgi:hypothetical protein